MRAIIIQDADARALLDQLKLESFGDTNVIMPSMTPEQYDQFNKVYGPWLKQAKQEMHRAFHHRVATWLSDQGASLVR